MRQLDEMTQHNAALVEETNAVIEQTEAQASELDRVVAVFTVVRIVQHAFSGVSTRISASDRRLVAAPVRTRRAA